MQEQSTYSPIKLAMSAIQIALMSFGVYFLFKKSVEYIKKPKQLPMHDDEEEEYSYDEAPDPDEEE